MKLNLTYRPIARLPSIAFVMISAASIASKAADLPLSDPPASTANGPQLTARQKLMSQFDLNKNGKLEPAEREAYLKHLDDERKKFIQLSKRICGTR